MRLQERAVLRLTWSMPNIVRIKQFGGLPMEAHFGFLSWLIEDSLQWAVVGVEWAMVLRHRWIRTIDGWRRIERKVFVDKLHPIKTIIEDFTKTHFRVEWRRKGYFSFIKLSEDNEFIEYANCVLPSWNTHRKGNSISQSLASFSLIKSLIAVIRYVIFRGP